MRDKTESDWEATEAQKDNERSNSFPDVSRRETIASLLGIGGFGVIGTSRRSAASPSPKPRPWNQDVDAQGNDLFNLGSLTMAANPKAITNLEGRNLAVDNDGTLNATGVSPWQDTDGDGRLETPDYDGIDVAKTTTNQLSVGGGEGVTGVWGNSGELVPLSEYGPGDTHSVFSTTYDFDSSRTLQDIVIPFASFSFTNIEQIYVSLVGILENGAGGATTSARIYDRTADTPLTNSEVQATAASDGDRIPVDGPKTVYNPGETTRFNLQIKSDTSDTFAGVRSPTIQVWGEIS